MIDIGICFCAHVKMSSVKNVQGAEQWHLSTTYTKKEVNFFKWYVLLLKNFNTYILLYIVTLIRISME